MRLFYGALAVVLVLLCAVSGIFVRLTADRSLLLDCGESTWHQMCRAFGLGPAPTPVRAGDRCGRDFGGRFNASFCCRGRRTTKHQCLRGRSTMTLSAPMLKLALALALALGLALALVRKQPRHRPVTGLSLPWPRRRRHR